MESKEVCIVLPALNEEGAIAMVIDEIPREEMEKSGYKIEILVVDNNSTDRTAEIAQEKGATVIVEPQRGKGKAIRRAFESVNGDFIFVLDADYTYPAIYIPRMVEVLEQGHDVVMGSRLRRQMEKGAMSRMNSVGNYLLTFMANTLYGTKISDLCTGYWGFREEVVKDLKLKADGFEIEANMFTEIAKKGCRIGEIPILYRRRTSPSTLNSLRDGFRIGQTLIRNRFR